jgi:high affinity sulfate transporter 1
MSTADRQSLKQPSRWRSFVPGVNLVTTYERKWLPKDVVAGLVLSALLVPQGMAYAELAGLPPVTGLYTSVLCLLGYAVFGPSRILVLGPDSALGPMIAATIAPLMLADHSPERAIALASMLAIIVGVVMVIAGVGRLGFVADLLSKPTQLGYMNGLAITILVGQLPKLFGFSTSADGLIDQTWAFFKGLFAGETNVQAAAIGIGSVVGIVILNRFLPKVPAVLVAVVLASLTVNIFNLQDKGVSTIGVLPQGLPHPTLPAIGLSDLGTLTLGALAIALVALADTISTATSFAGRRGERVNGNQEMVGIGTANIAAGLFQGFPVSTSASRTAVSEQAGSRSQVTGVVGAAVIMCVLVFANGLMKYVPQPTLAAVVIVAALSLADIPATRRLWRERHAEFYLSLAALLGVALLGVLPGILIAVALSILNVFRHAWWPYQAELGRVDGLGGLHDISMHTTAKVLPGLVVYRFDAPLIFANSRTFSEQIRELCEERPEVRWVVIASEPMTDVDTTAARMLTELDEWLNARGVTLAFAEMKDPVRQKIDRYNLTRTIDPNHFYPTVEDAVAAYQSLFGGTWESP